MKSDIRDVLNKYAPVAPLVGAWIEIIVHYVTMIFNRSLLSWERGLKFGNDKYEDTSVQVAPLVGAWIEIDDGNNYGVVTVVAPLVGAWIEIFQHLS